MKKLGVFITTHMERGYRHGASMERKMFTYFRDIVIGNYQLLDPGVDCDIYICDTGSKEPEYIEWIKRIQDNFIHYIEIPNKCGFVAAQKYLMHDNPSLADNYEYIMFHVDDISYPKEHDWANSMIEHWKSCDNLGIMGRFRDSIRLGPTGLVDHRNCCPQISQIWRITEIVTIPHLHAEYWLMDRETLHELSKVWWDPVHSEEAMAYQKKWEETNFCTLANLKDGRKTLDNIHIGRETDTPLRMDLIGKRMGSYKDTKFWPNCVEPYRKHKEYKEYQYKD